MITARARISTNWDKMLFSMIKPPDNGKDGYDHNQADKLPSGRLLLTTSFY